MQEMSTMVYAEVLNTMTPFEKGQLADELATLLQSQQVRVEVSQEKGFPYLWRVLTGKQRKLQRQITLEQAQINHITYTIMMQLWQKQVTQSQDINELCSRMNYLEKIVTLHSVYLMRFGKEISVLGGAQVNMDPLQTNLHEMMQEERTISTQLKSQPVSETESTENANVRSRIASKARRLLKSDSDFESFLKCVHFKEVNWELPVADGGVFWDTIYHVDGWKIQRWELDYNHYRILDPQKIRRAWTKDPEELDWLLISYQMALP